ncbi:MAG TPA: 3-hydroxyacyl-CoA dehydrogenase NAD-binding domain-containing protein [Candidatus Limnocylindrales bacterium]
MSEPRATVAIIGAGTMGAGIAQVALEAGWTVILHDPVPGATDKARKRITDGLARRAAKSRAGGDAEARAGVDPKTGAGADATDAHAIDAGAWTSAHLARLQAAATPAAAAADAHLVIEAAIEDLEIKQRLFEELDRAAPPTTILATNTSALSVGRIAEGARTAPERVVGMHFFNPAPVLALVEIVAATGSATWAVEQAAGFAEAWGKTPIRSTDTPGFIVNRVNRPFTLESLRLLRAGAGTVVEIDAAVMAAGFPMGPFALMDLIGIDVNLAAARGLYEGSGRPARFRPSPIQEQLVAAGTLGRKTGAGFYRYDGAKRIGPAARFERPERPAPGSAPIDGAQVADRIILAIVNEAYRALGDRVATAADIDQALRLGAGHPFGPFEWAHRTGLAEVAMELDALSDEDADTFRPALALLREARAAAGPATGPAAGPAAHGG